jgi:glucan 1,3-beta-glucosidase
MFIGEWSLATNPEAPFNDRNKFIQLASRMIDALNQAHSGWTYWTWKLSYDESGFNAWSLRTLLRENAFPFTPVYAVEGFTQ